MAAEEKYRSSGFVLERPILAVDVVVFTIFEGELQVLLYPRKKEPFAEAPALPGVAVRVDETLMAAARRSLAEKVGWSGKKSGENNETEEIFIEQLAAFDALYRDPRGRTVSIAYMGITRKDIFRLQKKGTHNLAKDGQWKDVFEIPKGALPFDHEQIIHTGVTRLRGKLRYTNIAKKFLPQTFRIEALQAVYKAVLRRPLNRNNFRNKLLKIGLIEQVSILTDAVGEKGGRPPHLYRFTAEGIEAEDRDFL